MSLALSRPLTAQDQLIPEEESYVQETVSAETGVLRSRLTGDFEKISGNLYSLKRSGKGSYGDFKDVTWNISSEMKLEKDMFSPVHTLFTIKDKDNRIVYTSDTEYDYEQGSIRVSKEYKKNEKPEKSTFELNPSTADYSTFIYFLRPLMGELLSGKTVKFNFVTSEPSLYKLKAR